MRRQTHWVATAFVIACNLGVLPPVAAEPIAPQTVIGVEWVGPYRLSEDLVRIAIGDLTGHAYSREDIRESLVRLWSLEIFSEAWVEEVSEPAGVRLRFHLTRRPYIQTITWTGQFGLGSDILASAAALYIDGDGNRERVERARRDLLNQYKSEGFFAAQVTINAREDPATNARDLSIVLQAGQRAEIGTVRIHGAEQLPEGLLKMPKGLRKGDDYREEAVRTAVRAMEERLRQDGSFSARITQGAPAWDQVTNQVDFDLEITPGPSYKVEFTGNATVKESVLREALTFAVSGVVDDLEVRTSAERLETVYHEQGYAFVQVTGSVDGESRVIRFLVVEGPRVTVESISLFGDRTFPPKELLNKMVTEPTGILRKGLFRQEQLDQDVLVLLGFYRSNGFLDATVGPAEVEFTADKERANIRIPIVEGPRVRLGTVTVEGATVLTANEILAALPVKPGDFWDPGRAEEGQRLIRRLYARKGYLGTKVTFDSTRRDGAVELTYGIVEGGQTRIGLIRISGLVLTHESVVLRELPFRSGDPFNPDALFQAESRLMGIRPIQQLPEFRGQLPAPQLFERVEIGPLQPPPTPFADVEVKVQEGKPWWVDVAVGYGTDVGPRATVQVGNDNLFGTGRRISIKEQVYAGGGQENTPGDQTSLVYGEPWVFGTPWYGEATLFRQDRTELGYKFRQYGGTVGIQRPILTDRIRGLYEGLQYRLTEITNYDVDPSLATANVQNGSQTVASIVSTTVLDRRDNILNPSHGGLHVLTLQGGGFVLGSEINFVKSELGTTWYLNWVPPTVLALSSRVGLATPLGNTSDLVIQDRFFAGGDTTIRGYPENKVGPLDSSGNPTGGDARILLNAEWRFPIWRWLGGAIFVDTGTVAQKVRDLSLSTFKTGVGASLRLITPVGPIRLDFGYALNHIPGENRWQFYFGVGNPF
ncbi:MAG TPA: outer membrane protein assembly factor BamA [archaeon]|nr:outer membrane protein assembly factor BamA [archaeon]